MDGYAVCGVLQPGQYPVQEQRLHAGVNATQLGIGYVAYITTGAMVPEGANAVVKIEDTTAVDAATDVGHIGQGCSHRHPAHLQRGLVFGQRCPQERQQTSTQHQAEKCVFSAILDPRFQCCPELNANNKTTKRCVDVRPTTLRAGQWRKKNAYQYAGNI